MWEVLEHSIKDIPGRHDLFADGDVGQFHVGLCALKSPPRMEGELLTAANMWSNGSEALSLGGL